MILAVKTTASPAELWAIVVVAVFSVALWLFMVEVFAPRSSARAHRRVQPPPEPDAPRGSRAGTTPRDGSGQDAGVQWTVPAQRESPTDQPAPADPGRGQRGGGSREQD